MQSRCLSSLCRSLCPRQHNTRWPPGRPQRHSPQSWRGCLLCGSDKHLHFSSFQAWKLQAVRWLWKLSPSLSGFLFLLIKTHLPGSQFGRKPGKVYGESGQRSVQQTWEIAQGKSSLKNPWKCFGRVRNSLGNSPCPAAQLFQGYFKHYYSRIPVPEYIFYK